ncbi:hypothetical protein [Mesorhizobium sp.]|uniref:hypothetical protein n=1 Tax=Mesorhizobium sp. TaxID=1871066 RepID=UPI0025B8EC90|nr:hypothetical protein [Mesorhizobium sp.]
MKAVKKQHPNAIKKDIVLTIGVGMPREGGVYSAPPGTKGNPNTTIESAKYYALVDDLVADANAARPVTAGGSGSSTAVGAPPGRC